MLRKQIMENLNQSQTQLSLDNGNTTCPLDTKPPVNKIRTQDAAAHSRMSKVHVCASTIVLPSLVCEFMFKAIRGIS